MCINFQSTYINMHVEPLELRWKLCWVEIWALNEPLQTVDSVVDLLLLKTDLFHYAITIIFLCHLL